MNKTSLNAGFRLGNSLLGGVSSEQSKPTNTSNTSTITGPRGINGSRTFASHDSNSIGSQGEDMSQERQIKSPSGGDDAKQASTTADAGNGKENLKVIRTQDGFGIVGNYFDKDAFVQSVKDVRNSLTDKTQKHDLLVLACSAFGFSTDVFDSDDGLNDAILGNATKFTLTPGSAELKKRSGDTIKPGVSADQQSDDDIKQSPLMRPTNNPRYGSSSRPKLRFDSGAPKNLPDVNNTTQPTISDAGDSVNRINKILGSKIATDTHKPQADDNEEIAEDQLSN